MAKGQIKQAPCVYRYIDTADNIVKYIGIVHSGTLKGRLYNHAKEKWCEPRYWKVEYFECNTRAEAEAFEAHLIALYKTYNYYNKCKANWGLNKYLPDVETWWRPTHFYNCTDMETYQFVRLIKRLIKLKEKDLALELLNYIEIIED